VPAAVPPASPQLIADLAACCRPVTSEVLSAKAAGRLADALKALADPARLRLVSLIAAHSDGEACVCDLTSPLGLTQPTVSHHLKVLVDTGLLERQQRGKWAYYRLVPGALDALAGTLTRASGSHG
jgi:ArsR family transcriptional regulator, arsenate/arsenite/antimonite-responsive transcriptional repressor